MSGISPVQPPPLKRARRTHARRSCLACRQRKARCELPDITVPSSMQPLERDLQCHRCKTLEMDCIVWDGDRKAGANRSLRYGPPQEKQASSSPACKAIRATSDDRTEAQDDLSTASEVVDTFSLWSNMQRNGDDAPQSADSQGRGGKTHRHGDGEEDSKSSKKQRTRPEGVVNPQYRSKLAMAYDRNGAQVAEIIYRSPQYAERASITHKMIAPRGPPARYDAMSPMQKSRLKSLVLAYPFLDPNIAEDAPSDAPLAPTEQWLRDVASYVCCRPDHTEELLASILSSCVYHSLMQTRSIYVCQGLLLMAIHEPIDLIFRKPSTEMEEIIDRAPGQSIFAAAFGIALSFRLDEAIPKMRSGASPMTSTTPEKERRSRLRDGALWLALHNFAVAMCEPGIKPRLPSSAPTQSDIETFESNVRPLLNGKDDRSPGQSEALFGQLHAAALIAHAFSAKFHRRLRTYWNETELLTVKSPDYVPSTRHFCLSLQKDGEAIIQEQAEVFTALPKHPALDIVMALTHLRLSNSVGRISAALLFTFGAHVAQKHGAFVASNILKGISTEPASSTACLGELNDVSEQTFRDTLKIGLEISRHDAELLNLVPPIMFSTAIFSATKHLVERQVFLSSNPKTRGKAAPDNILQAVRQGLTALNSVARGHRTSAPFIIHEVLSELIKRFTVAVDVLTNWIEPTWSRKLDGTHASDHRDRQSRRDPNQSTRPGQSDSRRSPSPAVGYARGPEAAANEQATSVADPATSRNSLDFGVMLHPHSLPHNSAHEQPLHSYAPFHPGRDSIGPSLPPLHLPPLYHGGASAGHPREMADGNPLEGGFTLGAQPASGMPAQPAEVASLAGLIRNDLGEDVLDLTALFDWSSSTQDPSGTAPNAGAAPGFHW